MMSSPARVLLLVENNPYPLDFRVRREQRLECGAGLTPDEVLDRQHRPDRHASASWPAERRSPTRLARAAKPGPGSRTSP